MGWGKEQSLLQHPAMFGELFQGWGWMMVPLLPWYGGALKEDAGGLMYLRTKWFCYHCDMEWDMEILGLRLWIHFYLSEPAEHPAPLLCYEQGLSSWLSQGALGGRLIGARHFLFPWSLYLNCTFHLIFQLSFFCTCPSTSWLLGISQKE